MIFADGTRALGRGLHPTDPARALVRVSAEDHDVVGAALSTLSGSADLTAASCGVLNQGVCEGCWAHSAVTLEYTRKNLLGLSPTLQSPLFFMQSLYAMLRGEQTPADQTLPQLLDTGAQLDDAVRAFTKWGSVSFGPAQQGGGTDVPATQDDQGNPIPMAELTVPRVEVAQAGLFGGPYDIAPGNPDLVCATLESKRPVWLGGLVGQAVMQLQAGQIEQATSQSDPTAGGHARAVLGYKSVPVNGTLKRRYRIRNSWGASWCDNGDSWAEEDVIVQAWSLLLFEVTP